MLCATMATGRALGGGGHCSGNRPPSNMLSLRIFAGALLAAGHIQCVSASAFTVNVGGVISSASTPVGAIANNGHGEDAAFSGNGTLRGRSLRDRCAECPGQQYRQFRRHCIVRYRRPRDHRAGSLCPDLDPHAANRRLEGWNIAIPFGRPGLDRVDRFTELHKHLRTGVHAQQRSRAKRGQH